MKRLLGWLLMTCLVVACSNPDVGPPLGDFPAISKTTADVPFVLTAPSSRSPAAFTFTSSNAAVATISGATVTILAAGTSTITASQPSVGSFGPTSKSTTLTVTASSCQSGYTLVNGACQANRNCISPATQQGSDCVAPASSGVTNVTSASLIWVGIVRTDNWANARDYCGTTVIDSVAGWRQPSADELTALYAANVIAGHGWTLGETWTQTKGTAASSYVIVDLRTGARADRAETASAYVSCVR
jgi:hypothetical protein